MHSVSFIFLYFSGSRSVAAVARQPGAILQALRSLIEVRRDLEAEGPLHHVQLLVAAGIREGVKADGGVEITPGHKVWQHSQKRMMLI